MGSHLLGVGVGIVLKKKKKKLESSINLSPSLIPVRKETDYCK